VCLRSHFWRTQVEGPDRTGAAAAAREWCSHAIRGRRKRSAGCEDGRNGWRDVCVCANAGVHGTAANPYPRVECAAKRTRNSQLTLLYE